MFVIIQNKVQKFPVTSITLSHDPDDPDGTRLHMFFCPNCGTPLGQYKGMIYSIMPGQTPVPLPWVQRCNTCKRKYAISSIV